MQHHAYLYEGPQEHMNALFGDAKKRFNFTNEHDPDVHVRQWEKFGIDDAQELKSSAQLKSAGGRALFVLGIASITSEAQQALLKLFEEPQKGAMFVLLVPHGALLPTLRSRMMPYPEEKKVTGQNSLAQVLIFLKTNTKARSEVIAELLKDEENQKERVRDFLNGLEAELSKKISNPKVREGLQDIAKVRSYLADRSPSLKMLLEHLALSLPAA